MPQGPPLRQTIALVGADSPVGRWLIALLGHRYDIIALSADKVTEQTDQAVRWRWVDFYSITSATEALRGADFLLYLFHDARPSTRLNQGSVADANLLLADTVARAAVANRITHVVLMGSVLGGERRFRTDDAPGSQREVEWLFSETELPLTILHLQAPRRDTGRPARLRRAAEHLLRFGTPRAQYAPDLPAGVFGNRAHFGRSFRISTQPLHEGHLRVLPPLPAAEPTRREANTVRSYQRLVNPDRQPTLRIAKWYFQWLPHFLGNLVQTRRRRPNEVAFHVLGMPWPILRMEHVEDRSNRERQLFYITGGLLVKRTDHGWLEFRNVMGGRYVMTAIHEFVPRLPWFLYISTQARLHLWVMNSFGNFLEEKAGA
ncbi:MAG: hypothetical protein WBA12_10710 [Catalinimonas sp.]